MILSSSNISKVPREVLKPWGFALGFQHFPRVLENVNEWKIVFDLSNEANFLTSAYEGRGVGIKTNCHSK